MKYCKVDKNTKLSPEQHESQLKKALRHRNFRHLKGKKGLLIFYQIMTGERVIKHAGTYYCEWGRTFKEKELLNIGQIAYEHETGKSFEDLKEKDKYCVSHEVLFMMTCGSNEVDKLREARCIVRTFQDKDEGPDDLKFIDAVFGRHESMIANSKKEKQNRSKKGHGKSKPKSSENKVSQD